MSLFVLSFDVDRKDTVLAMIKQMPGISLASQPAADGTVKIRTKFRDLDSEAEAVHAIEDIEGVIDLRLV